MLDILEPLIKKFMPFAQKEMGFERPPKLFLRQDSTNASDPLGKTGFYDPDSEAITLYVNGRHPKDILRSLSHELMHHTQKCDGKFENVTGMGEQGYAQADPHMRTMEIEAYQASIVFRDWEDSLKETIYYEHLQKGDKKMSIKDWKNGEIKTLLAEAWGFKFNTLQEFDEFNGTGEIQEEEIEEAATGSRLGGDRAQQQCKKQGKKMVAGKCVDPDSLEEDDSKVDEGDIAYKRDDDKEELDELGAMGVGGALMGVGKRDPGTRAGDDEDEEEDLDERHKPDNVTQGRDSARSTKKVATGQKLREDITKMLRKYIR